MRHIANVGLLFAIITISACSDSDPPTGPTTGSITLTVTTSGDDSPAGYTAVLDGTTSRAVEATGTTTFTSVSAGTHEVELSEVPGNCTVTSASPANVTVTAGDLAQVTMSVECSSAVGSIQIMAETTGFELDPDGYLISVDGEAPQALEINGSLTFSDIPVGNHQVTISGVADNCVLTGSETRSVIVTEAEAAGEVFSVECESRSRILYYFASEIYTINPDGTDPVDLTGPDGGNRAIWSPDGSRIAFTDTREGVGGIFTMNADGSDVTRVTSGVGGPMLSWSPDGSSLAFSDVSEIHSVDTDGSNLVNLTNHPAADHYPTWSPDGTQIAFIRYRDDSGSQYREIYVMNADGSNQVRLTSNPPSGDSQLSWSPDGGRIAFRRSYEEAGESYGAIYIMKPDGSDLVNLSNGPGGDNDPTWSPDGSRIAFRSVRDGTENIDVMNADGSDLTRLTSEPGHIYPPSWSPDGTRIAYGDMVGFGHIFTVNVDSSEKFPVTSGAGPSWSP